MIKALDIDALPGARSPAQGSAVKGGATEEGLPLFDRVLARETGQMGRFGAQGQPDSESGLKTGLPLAAHGEEQALTGTADGNRAPARVLPEKLANLLEGGKVLPEGGTGLPPLHGPQSAVPGLEQTPGNVLFDSSALPVVSPSDTLPPVNLQVPGALHTPEATLSSVTIDSLGPDSTGITLSMVLEQTGQNPATQNAGQPAVEAAALLNDGAVLPAMVAEKQVNPGVIALSDTQARHQSAAASIQIQAADPRRQLSTTTVDDVLQTTLDAGPVAKTTQIQATAYSTTQLSSAPQAGTREPVMSTLFNSELQQAVQARGEVQPLMSGALAGAAPPAGEQTLADPRLAAMTVSTASPQTSTTLPESSAGLRALHTVSTPVAQPGWDQEFGGRINYMIRNDQQVAELRLNPASLGVVEIRISTEHDKAEVTFFTQNPATRELLETALPRLRETLAANGVQLEQAHVSADSMPDRQGEGQLADGHRSGGEGSSRTGVEPEPETITRSLSLDTLVDTYI